MRRFAVVALVVAGLALPTWAQRSMSRGSFSGHMSQTFHGGFAAPHFSGGFPGSRSYGFPSSPRYPVHGFASSPRYPVRSSMGYGYPGSRNPGFRQPYMGANYRDGRHRRPYSSAYRTPIFYGVPGWIGAGSLGYYPYDFGYDDFGDDDSANYGAQDYEAQPAEQEQPTYSEEYQPSADTEQPVFRDNYEAAGEMPPPPPPQVPENEDATTIVFKDGRPSEQIHNYALTRTTLYVLDPQRRDIPLAQLDLAATEKANRGLGIEFQIPRVSP